MHIMQQMQQILLGWGRMYELELVGSLRPGVQKLVVQWHGDGGWLRTGEEVALRFAHGVNGYGFGVAC